MESYSKTQSGSANLFVVSTYNESQTPLNRNTNREGLLIFNDTDRVLLVAFGEQASDTEFSVKLAPGGYYESGTTVYVGPLSVIWIDDDSTGTGHAMITELEV